MFGLIVIGSTFVMKKKRYYRVLAVVVMAVVMLGALWIPGILQVRQNTDCANMPSFVMEYSYAAKSITKAKAKSVATKNAKSRFKIKKAYNVTAKEAKYRGKEIYKVTFYAKKSGKKVNYTYYVSKANGQIFYRKQYIK